MSFGVYIHIPYCLQRCHYCDFATYEIDSTIRPEDYFNLLKKEIHQRYSQIPYREISSIYFGGGTPSLVKPQFIINIINELANLGFKISQDTEVTIEINPGTSFDKNINSYLNSPINRFSVGAQTFSDNQLKACGRKHDTKETYQTLDLLGSKNLNFSLDILFALPHQTIDDLFFDTQTALSFKPKHISPYCLTVPKNHMMSKNRPIDNDQVKMFKHIKSVLEKNNYLQYEISNFCQQGYESKHNLIYWSDLPYWGIGLSSHSYFPKYNLRFWNPKTMKSYEKLINQNLSTFSLKKVSSYFNPDNFEYLKTNEQITDFCHTHLRKSAGLPKAALRKKFDSRLNEIIVNRLEVLLNDEYLDESDTHWFITEKGTTLSNLVFEKLCFTKNEII